MGLDSRYIYRMTHIDNISHIVQNGITHINSPNKNPNYKNIGDISLISSRNSLILPNGRTLGEYIPFYFGKKMPMLYVIQKGYNGVSITLPEDIVYCASNVQKIVDSNIDYLFTDGHAKDGYSSFYTEKDVNSIDNIIDLAAINSRNWKHENDLDLKRRKEAEFLVGNDVPFTCLKGFIVYNKEAKDKMIQSGINEDIIFINPNDYF
ncbi:MAG: type II toxin-antitoxin system toxin DNA ADP-ribosyl transferase DarT [Ignavibacteria bacterium]